MHKATLTPRRTPAHPPPPAPEPWALDHYLTVLNQIESRPGPPDDEGVRWMVRRLTGKAIAVCPCGLNTGLVDRSDLPNLQELVVQHPRSAGNPQVSDATSASGPPEF
ncbi:hypothetical protein PV383_38400 [Streptomyces caniscabiei]|uniref:Transposase n=1 Tax=Streptomyces caniscabiei TaxID=2746961 RepID=A0ABU4N3C8_9ACTN|nr:hypothetical protein [Streptomyces caniscabiei]MDX2946805.1 hypothetical protein [Streptomyces caniscabiei]MDX3043009.1 hypothetical protein [Streptomyces caniscabiei]